MNPGSIIFQKFNDFGQSYFALTVSTNRIDAELMQNLKPVGGGPSGNT